MELQKELLKFYYENGKVQEESTYKNGMKNGITKFYDENGNFLKQANFVDDKQVDQDIKYCLSYIFVTYVTDII